MRILVTNDDGIEAQGLKALVRELKREAQVFVVAPEQERSASSHSISLRHPLKVKELEEGIWSVDGTVADCVNLGLNRLLKNKPDLVISGINRGANLGCDIFYSGTVAGAREAVILGVPAFAISVEYAGSEPDYDVPAKFALRFAKYLIRKKFNNRVVFNVNFPAIPYEQIKGLKFTSQGIRIYSPEVLEQLDSKGNKFYYLNGEVIGGKPIPDSDIMAIEEGYISITPLALDFTFYQVLETLRKEKPEPEL